tara:strand:+ start:114 stop:272 length:159 start_codon:yes stop_codon:yes gene_type:complete
MGPKKKTSIVQKNKSAVQKNKSAVTEDNSEASNIELLPSRSSTPISASDIKL